MPEALSQKDQELLREYLAAPGLGRILREFRKHWEKYGRTAGSVRVETPEEARAISGIVGRHYDVGRQIKAAQIEDALMSRTRFGCGLREALECHFGARLVSRPAAREERQRAWDAALGRMRTIVTDALGRGPRSDILLGWLEADGSYLRKKWRQCEDDLLRDVTIAVAAITRLPEDDQVMGLAVLANLASGDSHALDTDRAAGVLFDRALAHLHPEVEDPLSRGAEGRDELHAAAGVAKDRTSPRVDAFGLRSDSPKFDFLSEFPLLTCSLRMAESLRGGGIHAAGGVVFAVENPAVFDQLVDRLLHLPAQRRPTLICTNGRLNLADRVLLRELVREGVTVRYSGDFDAEGLSIAASVLREFGPAASPWRMSADDYEESLSPASPMSRLPDVIGVPDSLSRVARAVSACGKAGFQEAIFERLLADLLAFGQSLKG
jgi:uncharacterized protein (TIGR02679 family)